MTSLVREYRAALTAYKQTAQGTEIHRRARLILLELGPMEVYFTVKCMLCGEEYRHETTVQEAAGYMAEPRGVCGNHGKDDVQVTLLET